MNQYRTSELQTVKQQQAKCLVPPFSRATVRAVSYSLTLTLGAAVLIMRSEVAAMRRFVVVVKLVVLVAVR